MIGAILIGLIVGWAYSWFLKRTLKSKCQEGVPTEFCKMLFLVLIPAVVIFVVSLPL